MANKMANPAKIVAAVIGIVGLFYAALPHSIHVSSGFGFGLTHPIHIAIGVVLIIIAIVVFMAAGKS